MLKWMMLLVYLLLLAGVLAHIFFALRLLRGQNTKRNIVLTVIVAVVAVTILAGILLPRSDIQRMIVKFSNYWLGFFIYVVTFLLILDIVWLIGRLVYKKKNKTVSEQQKRSRAAVLAVLVLAASLFCTVYGAIHERQLKTSSYTIHIDKDGGALDHVRIVLAADLHLGYSIGCKDMERMVEAINAQDPDVVMLAGDIYDNNYDALDDPDRLAEIFSGIKSRYGVYAIYGNHDVTEPLVGGFPIGNPVNAYRDPRIETLMQKSNITMLEDQSVIVADSFCLLGRLDGERPGAGPAKRAELSELMVAVDQTKPVLVMNHEPDELSTYADAGVDLLLSGHTHAGQFFPLTIVQPLAWQNYWGLKQIGQMYSMVTSGVGVYGPPIRTLTDSEIVTLDVTFANQGNQENKNE